MESQERRQGTRCPVCSGPLKEVKPDLWYCRNSLCSHNHKGKKCPRCGETEGISTSAYRNGHYEFVCESCEGKWSE